MNNLINISDLNLEDIEIILKYASDLRNKNENILKNKNIGLIFEKYSTRTRLSFQAGINQLQGNYIDIKLSELNFDRFETLEDTFEIFNCYLDAIIYRTDDHSKILAANKFFKKPLINALSDLSHPCQAISDIYTINERFGRINDLNIVWFGDLNNVLLSFAELCQLLDNVRIDIFSDKQICDTKQYLFKKINCIRFHQEINIDILNKCNCVMTDVYNSMNDKNDKEFILKKYQVNENIMNQTPHDAVFMHCLPAKINSEVTINVIKGDKSIVMKQAENRLHAQKGIMKWLKI